MERVAASPLRKDRHQSRFRHFQVDRLPEMPIRAVDVYFRRAETDRIAPQSKHIPLAESQTDPPIERGGGKRLLEVNDQRHALVTGARGCQRIVLLESEPRGCFRSFQNHPVSAI
jgi:hypothetical protein